MKETATAYWIWDARWRHEAGRQGWLTPETEVLAELKRLRSKGGALSALDLGCGVGRHALAMAAHGFRTSAYDASAGGLAYLATEAQRLGLAIEIHQGAMTALPYPDASFDYVLGFNVIYHGDGAVVASTIAEIARVLKPGAIYQGTMLSRRNSNCGVGREIAPGTFIVDDAPDDVDSDKVHPHFYCNAAELVALFKDFELFSRADRMHAKPGSWHWHLIAERG